MNRTTTPSEQNVSQQVGRAEVSQLQRTFGPRQKSKALQAIASGGLFAGILDLAYAISVHNPHHPIRVVQTVAAGLLGVKSYQEGMRSALVGVLLHFVIAFGAAAIYYTASRKLTFLASRPVIFGLSYGAAVYLFMHLVVLPISALPKSPTPVAYALCEFVEHGFLVGLPIALSVRRFR